MAEIFHETVFFSGHVQGVGFRYTTLQVAKEFDVSGFVANAPDGRVHLEIEGQRDQINAFISAIEERMHGHIRKIEKKSARRTPLFQGFTIQ